MYYVLHDILHIVMCIVLHNKMFFILLYSVHDILHILISIMCCVLHIEYQCYILHSTLLASVVSALNYIVFMIFSLTLLVHYMLQMAISSLCAMHNQRKQFQQGKPPLTPQHKQGTRSRIRIPAKEGYRPIAYLSCYVLLMAY